MPPAIAAADADLRRAVLERDASEAALAAAHDQLRALRSGRIARAKQRAGALRRQARAAVAARRGGQGPGPRVVDVAPELRHEAGPVRVPDWAPAKVAIAAHYSRGPVVSKSFSALLAELAAAGYEVVVASASEAPGELQWPHGRPAGTTVLRRPNVGYDFGSWASVLHAFGRLAGASRVLLTNDSLIGPFRSIAEDLAVAERTAVDLWGYVASTQIAPHVQSFLLLFRDGALAEPALSEFWSEVRVHDDKMAVVESNEVGLGALLARDGYVQATLYPWQRPENPTLVGWEPLLLAGFPFVKRMLVAEDEFSTEGLSVTRAEVAAAVADLYGTDLQEWL